MNKIKILIMKILFFVARKIKYGHITIKFSNGKKWEIDFSKGDQAFLSFDGGLKVFEIKYVCGKCNYETKSQTQMNEHLCQCL